MIKPSVCAATKCSKTTLVSVWGRKKVLKKSSNYDHPALYTSQDAFAERSYWDSRYVREPTTFEWYRGYASLQPILTQHLPKAAHILQLGVGTSRLQVDMADDGYSSITSIDYSPVAIQRLAAAYPGYPGLAYEVADARSMPQFAASSYGAVLDKGALDALLCGDSEAADAAAVLGEVWRLLQPGACYVMITSASPRARLPYLQKAATPWSRLLVYEVGQQGAMHGPFEHGSESSAAELQQLPRLGYSHLVYVCYK